MLGPVISRLRVSLLLLAFILGLGGQFAASAAMAAPTQAAMSPGTPGTISSTIRRAG
jgi:hypothetical protein